jgi:hypothetical protein
MARNYLNELKRKGGQAVETVADTVRETAGNIRRDAEAEGGVGKYVRRKVGQAAGAAAKLYAEGKNALIDEGAIDGKKVDPAGYRSRATEATTGAIDKTVTGARRARVVAGEITDKVRAATAEGRAVAGQIGEDFRHTVDDTTFTAKDRMYSPAAKGAVYEINSNSRTEIASCKEWMLRVYQTVPSNKGRGDALEFSAANAVTSYDQFSSKWRGAGYDMTPALEKLANK